MNTIKEKLGVLPIKALSKSSNFEKRVPKKIGSEEYVYSFVKCVLNGDISQASWCRELSKVLDEPISEQALQSKVQFRHEEFSQKLLESAIKHTMQNNESHNCCEFLSTFKSVQAHDSTCVKMPIGLIDYFPGSSSRNGTNSMVRIQLSMDLRTNSYHKIVITGFRKNDQSYGMEIAKNTKEGELHLFDLGYFQKKLLKEINEEKAYYLCRYFKVCIFKRDQELNVVKQLKSLDKQGVTTWDTTLTIGKKERIPSRMVAIKLSPRIAQKKRANAKKKRKQDGRKEYAADYIYLLGWNIYFTNVPSEKLSAKEIFRIYGLRWRIEIIFKAWKSKFDFVKMFAKQQYQLPSRAIIQINLILMTIIMFLTKWYQILFHLVVAKTGRFLSLLKFSGMVKYHLDYLHRLYKNDQEKLIGILEKQYCYDSRKDRLNFVEILYYKKLG